MSFGFLIFIVDIGSCSYVCFLITPPLFYCPLSFTPNFCFPPLQVLISTYVYVLLQTTTYFSFVCLISSIVFCCAHAKGHLSEQSLFILWRLSCRFYLHLLYSSEIFQDQLLHYSRVM